MASVKVAVRVRPFNKRCVQLVIICVWRVFYMFSLLCVWYTSCTFSSTDTFFVVNFIQCLFLRSQFLQLTKQRVKVCYLWFRRQSSPKRCFCDTICERSTFERNAFHGTINHMVSIDPRCDWRLGDKILPPAVIPSNVIVIQMFFPIDYLFFLFALYYL